MRTLRAILTMSTLAAIGCQVVGGFEKLSADGGVAGAGGGTAGVGGEFAGAGGVAAGAGGVAGTSGGSGGLGGGGAAPLPAVCGKGPPGMAGKFAAVVLPGGSCYWMSKDEVPVKAYRVFMKLLPNAPNGPCPGPIIPQCEAPTCGAPGTCLPTHSCSCGSCLDKPRCKEAAEEDRPVVCVNQCGAKAFCESVGQRLCTLAELTHVCAVDGTGQGAERTYPYPDGFEPGACNSVGPVVPSSTQNNCATPADVVYANTGGVQDLVGNASEWTDCSQPGVGGGPPECAVLGAEQSPEVGAAATLTCKSKYSLPGNAARKNLGFRCCFTP